MHGLPKLPPLKNKLHFFWCGATFPLVRNNYLPHPLQPPSSPQSKVNPTGGVAMASTAGSRCWEARSLKTMKKIALIRANDVLEHTCAFVTWEYADELVRDKCATWVRRHNGYCPFDRVRINKQGEERLARYLKLRDASCSPGERIMHDYAVGKNYAIDLIDCFKPGKCRTRTGVTVVTMPVTVAA